MIEEARKVAQRLRELHFPAIHEAVPKAADTIDALCAEVERLKERIFTIEERSAKVRRERDAANKKVDEYEAVMGVALEALKYENTWRDVQKTKPLCSTIDAITALQGALE